MPKIKNNPIMKGVRGMLGGVVVYREYRGIVIISKRPKKSSVLTAQQEVAKSNFLRAVGYAKMQMADATAKAEYKPSSQGRVTSAYAAAMKDFLVSPTIHELDASQYTGAIGDPVFVRASDDFKVVAVDVTILLPDGSLGEQGSATLLPESTDRYEYLATAMLSKAPGMKVIVTAKDKPGNVTSREEVF